MTEIIVEIEGGMVSGVYTDAPLEQEFNVAVLDHDLLSVDAKCEESRLTAVLRGTEWRGIDG